MTTANSSQKWIKDYVNILCVRGQLPLNRSAKCWMDRNKTKMSLICDETFSTCKKKKKLIGCKTINVFDAQFVLAEIDFVMQCLQCIIEEKKSG